MKETETVEHIRLLSIGHFVMAGLLGLFSLFPLIHIAVGIAILTGAFQPGGSDTDFPDRLFGGIFLGAGLLVMAAGFSLAAVTALAGKKLKNLQGRTYCLVIAGILCAIFPVGTALGVLTIVVLARPEARDLFSS